MAYQEKSAEVDVDLQQAQCPEGCCTGNEILCISIPCPVTIVLLGIPLTLNLPCLSLGAENPLQTGQVVQLLQALLSVLSGILGAIPTSTTAAEALVKIASGGAVSK
jgi:hypothetical protein